MEKLINKSPSTSPSHRAQIVWSLCVAAVVALVVLQQAMASRRIQQRSTASQTTAPTTLVTGKPVPLSQEELRTAESSVQ